MGTRLLEGSLGSSALGCHSSSDLGAVSVYHSSQLMNPFIRKKGSKSFNFFSSIFWGYIEIYPHVSWVTLLLPHWPFVWKRQVKYILDRKDTPLGLKEGVTRTAIPANRQLHLWAEGEPWGEHSASFQTGLLQRKASAADWAAWLTVRARVKYMSS